MPSDSFVARASPYLPAERTARPRRVLGAGWGTMPPAARRHGARGVYGNAFLRVNPKAFVRFKCAPKI